MEHFPRANVKASFQDNLIMPITAFRSPPNPLAPAAAPYCPAGLSDTKPSYGSQSPDTRAGFNPSAASYLNSALFEELSAPRFGYWAPRIYTPIEFGSRQHKHQADTLAQTIKKTAWGKCNPSLAFVLLTEDDFSKQLKDMEYAGSHLPAFRQPNGIVLINGDRAFTRGDDSLTGETKQILGTALQADKIKALVCERGELARLLPTRLHVDERFLTKEEAAQAFADALYLEALVARHGLQHRSQSAHDRMALFRRLNDCQDIGSLVKELDAGQADSMYKKLISFILTRDGLGAVPADTMYKKLISFTLTRYAELLEEKINPLCAQPIRIGDYIESVTVKFAYSQIFGHVPREKAAPLRPAPMFFWIHPSRPRSHRVLMHELVHVADHLGFHLAVNAVMSRKAGNQKTSTWPSQVPELCNELLGHQVITIELLADWLTYSLIGKDEDHEEMKFMMPNRDTKLLIDGNPHAYKAAFHITDEAIKSEGEAFMTPFLGKRADNFAKLTAEAETLAPRLNDYCQHALRNIKARGEWS